MMSSSVKNEFYLMKVKPRQTFFVLAATRQVWISNEDLKKKRIPFLKRRRAQPDPQNSLATKFIIWYSGRIIIFYSLLTSASLWIFY